MKKVLTALGVALLPFAYVAVAAVAKLIYLLN